MIIFMYFTNPEYCLYVQINDIALLLPLFTYVIEFVPHAISVEFYVVCAILIQGVGEVGTRVTALICLGHDGG